MSEFYNCDCVQAMRAFGDDAFDLAIVDPPYGDGGGVLKSQDLAERLTAISRGGGTANRNTPTDRRNMGEQIR